MKMLSSQEIIDQYTESGIISQKATLEGDYKSNNKEGKKLIKIFKMLENDVDLAKSTLPVLFQYSNVVTRTDAAAHCLSLKIFTEEAEKVLEDIAREDSNGIFGFNAEMTLKVWREQGYLKMYPKQESRI